MCFQLVGVLRNCAKLCYHVRAECASAVKADGSLFARKIIYHEGGGEGIPRADGGNNLRFGTFCKPSSLAGKAAGAVGLQGNYHRVDVGVHVEQIFGGGDNGALAENIHLLAAELKYIGVFKAKFKYFRGAVVLT